jgi:proprotein convertase subtilisin/kexin type 5
MKWQLTLLLLASVVAQPTPSDQCKVYDYVNGVCSQCVETYYLQVYFCLPCAPLCLCQNSSNFCTQCLTVSRGRYDVASYYDASLNRCWYCDEFMNNCAICDNALTCKLCYGGYLIDPATNQCSNNTCTGNCQICNSDKVTCKICQDGFNLDTTTGLCDAVTCQSNCLVCKNSTACLRCNLTYYAQSSDGTCQSCMDNCLTCNSADNCLNCTPSFVYQNGSCQNTTLSNCVIYSDDYSTCLNC